MTLMSRIADGVLKLCLAAEMMKVSYRQAKRIWRRYRQEGDGGLVHKSRGRCSNRTRPAGERKRALALYERVYHGFGPLLASEHLATDHGLIIDHETLRRWLIAAGFWKPRHKREKHRSARERRPRRGDLVQIDGSEHDWFEGSGPRPVLMVMIDDATNTTLARFYTAEDTAAAFDIFERYIRLYGLPRALYPDRDSIYVCTREANLEEELSSLGPETQFGRAMRELDVDMFPAYSPQAKGRVERRHGLFQDRLVKEMRLQHIRSIEEANAYLDMTFLPMVNTRYVVRPLDSANGHRSKPSDAKIAMTLAWQETRSVAKDWTISWRNKRFQIDARNRALNLPGRRVTVIEKRNGGMLIRYKERILTFRDAPAPTVPVKQLPLSQTRSAKLCTPAPDHPYHGSSRVKFRFFCPPPTSYWAHSRGAKNHEKTTTPMPNIIT